MPDKTEEVSVGIAAPAGASGEVLLDDAVLDEFLRIHHLYPSCSHGHLSYSPDGEYTCWDGSPASTARVTAGT